MSKLFLTLAHLLVLLSAVACVASADTETDYNTEDQWRIDAIAYIDEMIGQSGDKSDIVSTQYSSCVIIRNTNTLERIKTYIRNAEVIQDVTNACLAPSPTPFYTIGKMPSSCYDSFYFEYEEPRHQSIIIMFTETDEQELLDYLNSVINVST
jgi:hypothetical protein